MMGKPFLHCLIALASIVLAAIGCCPNASAQIYIGYRNAGIVHKYDIDTGAMISERFITDLPEPRAICLVGDTLYIAQTDSNISTYSAQTGAKINEHFITGLNMPQAMTISDGVPLRRQLCLAIGRPRRSELLHQQVRRRHRRHHQPRLPEDRPTGRLPRGSRMAKSISAARPF